MARSAAVQRTVWVEKTVLKNSFFRANAAFDLGKVLLSPTTSDSGSDIYRLMRVVTPGDAVLHLVDNRAFVGMSLVCESHHVIQRGLSSWFIVPLTNYINLRPSLERTTFFAEPFASELARIAIQRKHRLFYTRTMRLQQGAYLSQAPEELITTLERAYKSSGGSSIIDLINNLPKSAS